MKLVLVLALLMLVSCGKETPVSTPAVERAKDPVCGMWVEKHPKPGHPVLDVVVFDNACYFFCAEECSKEFSANPTKYTKVCKCPHSRSSDLFPEDRNCKCEHCQGKMEPCDCNR